MSSAIIYPEACGGFFASAFPGQEPGSSIIYFERQADGFVVIVPPGVDWADYEPQPDLEVEQPDDEEGNPVSPVLVPQPPIRHPREPWLYYQQELGVEREQPTWEEVEGWSPTRESEAAPLTDVEKEAMEKAAPAKALIVEDAMAARATLATAREKASGAKDLGEVKEAVQVLAEALDAVLAKMQGEQKK